MVYPRDIVRKWDGLRVLSCWQQLLIFMCYSVRSLAPPRTQVAQLLACICMFRTVCYTVNIRRKKGFYTDSSKYYFMTTLINSRIFICVLLFRYAYCQVVYISTSFYINQMYRKQDNYSVFNDAEKHHRTYLLLGRPCTNGGWPINTNFRTFFFSFLLQTLVVSDVFFKILSFVMYKLH